MDIIKTYNRALRVAIVSHPSDHPERHRAFASAVAQLCCDNPEIPLNRRTDYLADLLKVSGGPSTREHACLWAAYRRGDAVQSEESGLTAFYVDPRFQLPGTWEFDFACKFCDPIVFGAITSLHREAWQKEADIYDDCKEDLEVLKSERNS